MDTITLYKITPFSCFIFFFSCSGKNLNISTYIFIRKNNHNLSLYEYKSVLGNHVFSFFSGTKYNANYVLKNVKDLGIVIKRISPDSVTFFKFITILK